MKCQIFTILIAVIVSETFCEKPHPKPLVFKTWPPKSNRLMMQLRGSGSSKVIQRLPAPNAMMVKAPGTIRFGFPMRPNMKLQASATNQFFYKATPHPSAYKTRPSIVSNFYNKFSTPPQKPAIKFSSPPPLKAKPEFVYEKVTVPKFPEPVRFTINSAIHTIPAPNLSGEKATEINHNNLNSQLDNDLTKFIAHGFALQPALNHNHHQHHQYQVNEITSNDATIKNTLTGHKTYFAPDSDPKLKAPGLRPIDDPLSIPSDGRQKPLDVLLYQQNLNYGAAAPLVQVPHFAVDPYSFPVTTQPQLQQYQALQQHQNSMIKHLDPTFLVSQSNSLYNQHQQMLGSKLFTPQGGAFVAPVTAQPNLVTINEVASIGQIYNAQRNANINPSHETVISTTFAPTTVSGYQGASSHEEPVVLPAISQVEAKPQNYLHSQNNFIDLPEEHLSQNDIQNFLNYEQQLYNDYLNHRQHENDIILREAQEKLQYKLHAQQQQHQTAYDLHKLVQQEKFSPLRIVVPDEDVPSQFKKRVDDDENTEYYDEEAEDETATEDAKQLEGNHKKTN